MIRPWPWRWTIAVSAAALTGCGVLDGGRLGADVFVPRSDYGFAPRVQDYTEPGDCRGGSRLAAVEVEPPDYPRGAFRNGLQGWVVVRLDVDSQGKTRNVKIVDSQPVSAFNRAARRAVREWRFEPPGEPGLSRCVVVLDFRLGVAQIGL